MVHRSLPKVNIGSGQDDAARQIRLFIVHRCGYSGTRTFEFKRLGNLTT